MKTKNKSFKRLFAFLVALVMVTALVPSVIFAAEPTFTDVPADHWAYDYIEELAEADIIGGYGDGTFGPEDNVTRQQAAKMIAKAADLEASKGFVSKFADFDKVGDDLKPFVKALEENKVVGGFADGSFGPTLNIKRSQAAKMVVNAFDLVKGELDVKFDDPVADATDQSYIDILASNGIVKGYTEDGKQLFKPYNLVTRAQLAKMIVEAMEWEVEVLSVEALTKMVDTNKVNTNAGVTLQFAINGETRAASVKALTDAGYDVEFLATAAVFRTTSSPAAKSASGLLDKDVDANFQYKVVISLDDEVVAESKLVTVEVLDYKAIAGKVEFKDLPAYIQANATYTGVVSKMIVTALDGETILSSGYKAEFKALTPAIATIDKDSGNVTPITSGDAKFSVTITDTGALTDPVRAKAEFTLKIVSAAPVATTVTADPTSVKLANAAGVSQDVVLTVLDQYGEPIAASLDVTSVKGATFYDNGVPTAVEVMKGSEVVVGKYKLTIEAASATTVGKDTLTVKIGAKTHATVAVEFVDGKVASYKLEQDEDNVAEVYASIDSDELVVYLNGYTATGAYAGAQQTEATKYVATLTNPDASTSTLSATAGAYKFVAAKAGKYTLTLTLGEVTFYSLSINVVDAGPEISGVSALSTHLVKAGTYDIDKLVKFSLTKELNNYYDADTGKDKLVFTANEIQVKFADSTKTNAVLGTFDLKTDPSDSGAAVSSGSLVLTEEDKGTLFVRVFKGDNVFTPDYTVAITFDVPEE